MTDPIMHRICLLKMRRTVEDIAEYADEWYILADDAEKLGRIATAASCRKQGDFYALQVGKEFIRYKKGCVVELVPTETSAKRCALVKLGGVEHKVIDVQNLGNYQNVYRDGSNVHIPAIPILIVRPAL